MEYNQQHAREGEHPRTHGAVAISIPEGLPINIRRAGGRPPGATASHEREVRTGNNQSERPPMKVTLLKIATEGNTRELRQLLRAQPRPRISDLQGVTSDWDGVLHIAARLGHVDLVSATRDMVNVAAKNRRGETALHCAAATGNVNMIALLISMAGEDANKMQLLRERKCNGETCLHDAVRCGERAAVERLVEEDVNVRRDDGCLALVKIPDDEGVSPLYLATTLRKIDIVRFLTVECDDRLHPVASYAGPGNKTALHAAVLLSKELSEELVDWKKELIEKADVSGNTPLHLLASTRDKSIAELLLEKDEYAGYRADEQGSLPIHVAAANGSLEIVKLLSDLRPNCAWSCNNLGQTILHIAVQKRRRNVVEYLCSGQKFARILNTRDIDGNTALHLAVRQGDQSIFCHLMRRREVCLSFTNKEERTPLDLAQLSLPPGLSLLPTPRKWIMYSLVLAEADYGTCRTDHLDAVMAEPDKEKETKSIGKSAGLVAVCAALILTIAFAVPFNVTKLYSDSKDSDHNGRRSRVVAYRIFMVSDALAFASSAIAISCCTFAGFSFMDSRTRSVYLAAGGDSLRYAALFIIVVFISGVYVAVVPIDFWITVAVCSFGVLVIVPQLEPVFVMLLHAWTLLRRLGFPTWWRTLFCMLPRQRQDRIPPRYLRLCRKSLAVVISIYIVCYIIYTCAFLSFKPSSHRRQL